MVGLGDLDAGRQPLLLLLGERDVLDGLAEAHHEGRDVGVLEHLHLVVADQDGDVGLRLLEHPRHLGHGALAGVVALLLDRQLDLLLQVLLGAQLRQLVELERAVAKDQRGIAPVGFDPAAPLFGRRRQQGPCEAPMPSTIFAMVSLPISCAAMSVIAQPWNPILE